MRTTFDIREDLMREVATRAAEEHRSMKDVVCDALALGFGKSSGTLPRWTCPTHELGAPRADYTRAWALLDDLDADLVAETRDRYR